MAHTFKALSLWAQSNNNWKEFPIKPQLDAEKVAEGFEDGRWAVGKAGDSRRRPHGPALSTSVSRIWNICMGKLSLWLHSTHIGVSRHLGSIVSVSSEQSWDIGVSICQYPVRCLANLSKVALASFLLGEADINWTPSGSSRLSHNRCLTTCRCDKCAHFKATQGMRVW